MNHTEILTLYDYNYWANRKVLNAAAHVTPEQWVAPAPASHGSLRGAIVHVFGAEVVWRMRVQEGVSLGGLPPESEFPTLDSLVQRWNEEEEAFRRFLALLTDDDLSRTIRYTNTEGKPYETILWHILVHVVNHGTQFRGEAGVVLTGYGHSPGDLDMILFFRERQT
jgi:uncharacterized damage-inducible protein DinB